ncbi:MAG: CsgG/HfaB family protein [Myxococcota bacterium]
MVFFILAFVACAHQQLADEAEEFAAAGHYKLASERALESLEADPGYTRATLLLASSAPKVVNDELREARAEAEAKDFPAALARLAWLESFASEVEQNDIDLETGKISKQLKNTRRGAAADEYAAAERLFSSGDLEAAIPRYESAEQYVPGYRECTERRAEASYRLAETTESRGDLEGAIGWYKVAFETIPEYRESREQIASTYYRMGKQDLASGRHRSAVISFERAEQWIPDYEDAAALSARAAEEATVRIAIVPLDNRTDASISGIAFEDLLYDRILKKLDQGATRFLQVIDRDSLDLILTEHGFGDSGRFDASTLPPGELSGVSYLITGRVTQLTAEEEGPTRIDRQLAYRVPAYQQVPKQRKDGSVSINYVKAGSVNAVAHYTDVSQSSKLVVRGSVKLLDVASGRVIATRPFSFERADSAHYAENLRRQSPPGSRDKDVERRFPSEVIELSKGKKDVLPVAKLAQRAASKIATKVASTVLETLDQPTRSAQR